MNAPIYVHNRVSMHKDMGCIIAGQGRCVLTYLIDYDEWASLCFSGDLPYIHEAWYALVHDYHHNTFFGEEQ